MKNFYLISALLVTTFATSTTFAQPAYDVSGRKGDDGQSAGTANRSQNGYDGRDADDGASAGTIEATIGFVEGSNGKEVYIKGYRQRYPGEPMSAFEDRVPTSSLTSILFAANGGAGGTGGRGGAGGRGRDGADGSDASVFSFNYDGRDGEDGEHGGIGGRGGRGGRGGSAGSIKITLAPGAELLAPLVALKAEAGRGGEGGNGGEGGPGGEGGDKGRGICADGSRPNIFSYGGDKIITDAEGKEVRRIRCGQDGDDGRDGNRGKSGMAGGDGSAGNQGNTAFAYANGKPVTGRYEVVARNWLLEQKVADGVVEPKEELKVSGVVLENRGNAPVPAATYTVEMAGGKRVAVAVDELPPGAKREIRLDSVATLEAPASGVTQIPMTLQLDALVPGTAPPPPARIAQPVELKSANDLNLTTASRDGEMVFTVANNSTRSYGAEGETARSLKLRLNPSGDHPPLVEVSPGNFQPITKQLEIDIPKLAAGESRQVRLKVKASENWRPGEEFSLTPSLAIADSKVAPQKLNPAKLAYSIDKNDGFKKNFSVRDLDVTCQYYHALWFNYPVESVSVRKKKNNDEIEVRVEIEGGKESPLYTIKLADVPEGFLRNVLNEKPFTSNQLLAFIQQVNLEDKGPFYARSRWNVRSCYAAEDKVGKADTIKSAARRASQVNDREDHADAGMIGERTRQVKREAASAPQPQEDGFFDVKGAVDAE